MPPAASAPAGPPADHPAARISPPDWMRDPALAAVLAALAEPDLLRAPRLVGGCVRDLLAARPVKDIDIATPLDPEAVTARLLAAGLKAVPTGLAHGTVTAVAGGRPFEITTLRRDVATDGRHATVAFTADWAADAARRDFTINALSLSEQGDVFDPAGGLADLAAGRVRFVGEPARRIAEDYLRILRFFRFHARFGRGEPDPAAMAAIRAGLAGLARLSAERVWMELRLLLALPDPAPALALMAGAGALAAVLPEMRSDALDRLAALVAIGAPADPLLRLAALLPDAAAGAALGVRLKLANAERERLAALLGPPARPAPALDEAGLRRALARLGRETACDLAWLGQVEDPAGDASSWAVLRARVAALPVPRFPLAGADVLAAGLPPGPAVGRLLAELEAWWLDGGCVADRFACLAELARRAAA